jgi:WD40 repeat protein
MEHSDPSRVQPASLEPAAFLEPAASLDLGECITALTWHPQRLELVAATAQGEIQRLQLDVSATETSDLTPPTGTGEILQPATEQSIDCLEFSVDGEWLAAAGQQGVITLWRAGEFYALLETQNAWLNQIQWHPQQNWLAFEYGRPELAPLSEPLNNPLNKPAALPRRASPSSVQVWDVEGLTLVATLPAGGAVQALDWSPDGQYLAIASRSSVRIWAVGTWEQVYCWELHTAALQLKWSADGQWLALTHLDRGLAVLNWTQRRDMGPVRLGKQVGKIQQISWGLDGRLAIATSPELWVWTQLRPFPQESAGYCLGATPSGSTASALINPSLINPQIISPKPASSLHQYRALAVHPTVPELLATLELQGAIALWFGPAVLPTQTQLQHRGCQLTWHPSGTWLAAGSEGGEVALIKITSGL